MRKNKCEGTAAAVPFWFIINAVENCQAVDPTREGKPRVAEGGDPRLSPHVFDCIGHITFCYISSWSQTNVI